MKSLFDALRIIAAVIGGLALAGIVLFMGLVGLLIYAGSQPLKWPHPTRDCMQDGVPVIGERQLIARAYDAWEAESAKYADAYRQQHAGGPLVQDKTRIDWLNTVPDDGHVYTADDYDADYEVETNFRRARSGLRRYARVTLTLFAALDPAEPAEPRLTTRSYEFDACGQEL